MLGLLILIGSILGLAFSAGVGATIAARRGLDPDLGAFLGFMFGPVGWAIVRWGRFRD